MQSDSKKWLVISLYVEGKSKQVVGKVLTSPGEGKRLFFNLGVASLSRGKGSGDIQYRFELSVWLLLEQHCPQSMA